MEDTKPLSYFFKTGVLENIPLVYHSPEKTGNYATTEVLSYSQSFAEIVIDGVMVIFTNINDTGTVYQMKGQINEKYMIFNQERTLSYEIISKELKKYTANVKKNPDQREALFQSHAKQQKGLIESEEWKDCEIKKEKFKFSTSPLGWPCIVIRAGLFSKGWTSIKETRSLFIFRHVKLRSW